MYNIGEKVEIVKTGEKYSTYYDWFNVNARDVDHSIIARYGKNSDIKEGETYTIIAKGAHENNSDMLYLITTKTEGYKDETKVILIGEKGIARKRCMTISEVKNALYNKLSLEEIEKILGYNITVIHDVTVVHDITDVVI